MDSKINCICNEFYEITEFRSINEFERFQQYLNNLLTKKYITKVPVKSNYAAFKEEWYKCTDCYKIWRLVYPDFPFKGLWEKIGK